MLNNSCELISADSIKALADKLGVASTTVVDAFARQIYKEGLAELTIFIIATLAAIISLKALASIQKEMDLLLEEKYRDADNQSYDYIINRRDRLRDKIEVVDGARMYATFIAGFFVIVMIVFGPMALYDLLSDPTAAGITRVISLLKR